ncbi:major facilitator superfamily domain-containing protein [Calycina marina]|uniref:Major facilitator superfamily domain-containing protein n=1 Tax=Calycina marina TaxID=1763456 RepID=A0A9P7YUM2_9HELO|nr:major facilitator superfamily domain-containing protein [Calycina marina]
MAATSLKTPNPSFTKFTDAPLHELSKHTSRPRISERETVAISLGWKTWLVVFITCFAIMAQVFVIVTAESVVAFIIRDIGSPARAGWIIQGPLLMQSALSPIIGRLSDVVGRKYLAAVPPLIAFAGSVVSAKAESMTTLIGGGILIGVTLSTISIVQAIPSEVLPMRQRTVANGLAFAAGGLGALIGNLGAGSVTSMSPSGWRNIFWMQAAFHLATALGLLVFYNPPHPAYRSKLPLAQIVWAIDPIGSALFIGSITLMLLGIEWAGGTYKWADSHVAAPLGVGLGLLLMFCIYEWKGRQDGLVAHVFFQSSPNFALWIFYCTANSYTPQVVLNLGFEDNSLSISIRQLSFTLVNIFASIPITWYATKHKDMKLPLLITFTLFLVVTICYATITPAHDHAQIVYNVISGIGQAGPLTLLVALVQFTAPHRYLSTATGLAFSARAIGGAFGSAVLDVISKNKLAATYATQVGVAAVAAGLPDSDIGTLLAALAIGNTTAFGEISAFDARILPAALNASHYAYAAAYRLAWSSIIPFVLFAIVAVSCLKGVEELMTDVVGATVEDVPKSAADVIPEVVEIEMEDMSHMHV